LLFISGGSGITPVLSMLRTLCDQGYGGEVVFLHYAYTAADVAHRTELQQLAERHTNVRLVLAYTAADDGDLSGYFDREHLEGIAPWYHDTAAFLCGPPGLMRSVREHYKSLDLLDRLHTEEFTAPLAAVPDEAGGTVSFAASGARADNTGATLLEQAEAAGLGPEYGCRMGICFTCTQVKTSGCTRNIRTGETSSDPDTEIQMCINVPVGDVCVQL
jgi:ferredoxin-NADP reductase